MPFGAVKGQRALQFLSCYFSLSKNFNHIANSARINKVLQGCIINSNTSFQKNETWNPVLGLVLVFVLKIIPLIPGNLTKLSG
jgi:hypothetical protein